MTDQEIREIEERAEGASPLDGWEASVIEYADGQLFYPTGPAATSPEEAMADRLFIAHAREDIPKLCKEVRYYLRRAYEDAEGRELR